ncbi:unnamed protein product [Agarophyton chilense]
MVRKCSSCEKENASVKRPKTGKAVCKECFFRLFEDEVHETIVSNNIFSPGERVAIGASGGKDSTVLAYVLSLLNRRHSYRLDLFLLSVDEGISGYRDDSLAAVQRNKIEYGLPLLVVDYKQLYGWTMDQIVNVIGRKSNCTFCGVFRRQALDRGATILKADKVATGHNADDIAETIFLNFLRGDFPRLSRCVDAVTGRDSSLPRVKPFKYTYEKEIVMYAYFRKLDYFATECVYSPNAYRGHARQFLKDLEAERPSTSTVLISQAFRGRAFGSISSNDVAKRVSVGEDGSIYLAGVTTSHDDDHDAWGDVQSGELTGKRDIFIAKLSITGELQWVKRTGSNQNDDLNDFKLANDALYLCGSTMGNFGRPVNGSSDAYIMKFTLNGEKAWPKPFQFGSKGEDICHAIDIDESGRVYAVGSTNGRLYGTSKPEPGSFHHFITKLEELPGSPSGLRTVVGRQRGSMGNSSANQVAVVDDLLYVMTLSSRRQSRGETHATYLNIIDREALFLHKLHMLKSRDGVNFQGVRMSTSIATKNAYVIGFTLLDDMRKKYDVLKFNYSQNYKQGGIEWNTLLGPVSLSFKMLQFSTDENNKPGRNDSIVMEHQLPSIVVDEKNESVYVAGTEDGFYRTSSAGDEGLVVAPFYKLNTTSGEIVERWHRSTNIPHDRQELTDIALDPLRTVVYTGAWWLGAEAKSSVLLGSFGSTIRSSIADEWSTKPSFIQDGSQRNDSSVSTSTGSGRAGSIIMLTLACIGVIVTAVLSVGSRLKKSRPKNFRSVDSQTDELDNISIDQRSVIKFPPGSTDRLIGGSSGPQ